MKDSKGNRKGELIMKEHESDSETEGAETVRCPHVVGSSPTGGAINIIWINQRPRLFWLSKV